MAKLLEDLQDDVTYIRMFERRW